MKKRNPIPEIPGPAAKLEMTINHLLRQPIAGFVYFGPSLKDKQLDLYVSDDNAIVGELTNLDDRMVAVVLSLYISPKLRSRGIGKRLVQGFVVEAKREGAQELWSDSVSNDALRLRAKLFGKQAMTFYDADRPEAGFLPISYDQALMTNSRKMDRWKTSEGSIRPEQYLGVVVDLQSIDTDSWPGVTDMSYDEIDL